MNQCAKYRHKKTALVLIRIHSKHLHILTDPDFKKKNRCIQQSYEAKAVSVDRKDQAMNDGWWGADQTRGERRQRTQPTIPRCRLENRRQMKPHDRKNNRRPEPSLSVCNSPISQGSRRSIRYFDSLLMTRIRAPFSSRSRWFSFRNVCNSWKAQRTSGYL